jgi:hypothetical protein
MNEHVRVGAGGVVHKDNLNARPKREAPEKGQRKPLGLAPVLEELSPTSALEGVPADVLASPATIANCLEVLDSAIAIRSDVDTPLKVRLSRLESSNGELRAELTAAQATIARLEALTTALRSALPSAEDIKLRIAAEVKVRVAAEVKDHFAAMSKRAAERRAAQKKAGK